METLTLEELMEELGKEELEELQRLKAGLCEVCGERPIHRVFETLCTDCAARQGLRVCSLCGQNVVRGSGEICSACLLKARIKKDLEERIGVEIELEKNYSVAFVKPKRGGARFSYFVILGEDEGEDTNELLFRAQAALARKYDGPVSLEVLNWTGDHLVQNYYLFGRSMTTEYFCALTAETVTALEG
ncbi:MAG: hypothetical protein ACPLRW_12305 [Moorellales bacterium]